MRFAQTFYCLDLDDKTIIDKYVYPEGNVEVFPIDSEWYRDLSFRLESGLFKPLCQHSFIDVLEQSWTKLTMNAYRFAHHG